MREEINGSFKDEGRGMRAFDFLISHPSSLIGFAETI
jgi:hypothetical protein